MLFMCQIFVNVKYYYYTFETILMSGVFGFCWNTQWYNVWKYFHLFADDL